MKDLNESLQKSLIEFVQWILNNRDKWSGVKRVRCVNWGGSGQFLSLFVNLCKVKDQVARFSFHSAEFGKVKTLQEPHKKKIKLNLHPELEELNELLFENDQEIDYYKNINKKLNYKIKQLTQEIHFLKKKSINEKNEDENLHNTNNDEDEDFDLNNNHCQKKIRLQLNKYTVI